MTKEQGIKELNSLIKVNKDFFENQGNMLINKRDIEAIETVLNMLKDLQRENKYMHSELDRQQTTINNYVKEIEKKDKQIDLITEFLVERDLGYYKKEDGGEILGIMRIYNKDDWKQYFEKLAERKSKE